MVSALATLLLILLVSKARVKMFAVLQIGDECALSKPGCQIAKKALDTARDKEPI